MKEKAEENARISRTLSCLVNITSDMFILIKYEVHHQHFNLLVVLIYLLIVNVCKIIPNDIRQQTLYILPTELFIDSKSADNIAPALNKRLRLLNSKVINVFVICRCILRHRCK